MEEGGKVGEGAGLDTRGQKIKASFLRCIPALAAGSFLLAWLAAFSSLDLPEAAYVFLMPLLLWFMVRPTLIQVAVWVYPAAFIGWLVHISWLPSFTDHLNLPLGGLLGWLSASLLAAVLAIFILLWALAAAWLVGRACRGDTFNRILVMLALAGIWVVLEWVRSWIFTGFPWLPLAASQWQRPIMLQALSVTGAAGLSFILVFFNAGLSFYALSLTRWRGKRWWERLSPEFYAAFGALGAVLLLGIQQAGSYSQRQTLFDVAFVQPYIDAPEKWDIAYAQESFATIEHLSELAAYLQPDILLWPEATLPFPLKSRYEVEKWMGGLSQSIGKPILAGAVVVEPAIEAGGDNRWYNGVFWVDPQKGVDLENYYAKRHLVPFGEYVPFSRWLPFLKKVVPLDGEFHRGESAKLINYTTRIRTVRIAPLICYEDIFPALARSSARAGTDVFFVATNNAWFGEGNGAWQHAAHSVLRAVETRRPVLRCGNAGWSGWIDDYGHIRHISLDRDGSIFFRGVDSATITRSSQWVGRQTFYVRYGEWFVGFSALLCVPAFIRLRRVMDY